MKIFCGGGGGACELSTQAENIFLHKCLNKKKALSWCDISKSYQKENIISSIAIYQQHNATQATFLSIFLYLSICPPVYLSIYPPASSLHFPPRHRSLRLLFRRRGSAGCREQLFVWSLGVVQQNCYSIMPQKECTNRGRPETNTNQETHTAVISCIAVRGDWKSFINMATKQYLRYWTIASPPLAGNKYLQSMSERFTGTETLRLLLPFHFSSLCSPRRERPFCFIKRLAFQGVCHFLAHTRSEGKLLEKWTILRWKVSWPVLSCQRERSAEEDKVLSPLLNYYRSISLYGLFIFLWTKE